MNAPARPVEIDRSRFIGGSDCAAIIGVSPWATPLDCYLEKIGQSRPIEPAREKLFRRGKRLEPVVIDMLIEEYGVKVTKRSSPEAPNRYIDPGCDYLAAEIDFEWEVTAELAERFSLLPELVGTIQNGEVKTCHPFAAAKFGEAETDEIPIEYAAQAVHGLMVSGRRLTLFGVLVGADSLLVYWIHRDNDTIRAIREKETRFWLEHVLNRVPPAPVNLPDVLHLFGMTEDIRVQAADEALALYEQFVEAKAQERVAGERIEGLKYQLGRYMLGEAALERDAKGKVKPVGEPKPGKHLLLAGDKTLLTVAFQRQNRIDTDTLRRLHPEVATECSKTTSFYKFDLPRGKKS